MTGITRVPRDLRVRRPQAAPLGYRPHTPTEVVKWLLLKRLIQRLSADLSEEGSFHVTLESYECLRFHPVDYSTVMVPMENIISQDLSTKQVRVDVN